MHSKVVIFLAIAAYALVLLMPQGEGADATTAKNNSTDADIKLQNLHDCINHVKGEFEKDRLTPKGLKDYICLCLDEN